MNGIVPEPTGLSGRPRAAFFVLPEDLPLLQKSSATVHKTRENGRVTNIDYRTVFGTDEQVQAALAVSPCSRKVNTSFIERHNGTDRNRCSRKVRKSYCFSKDWDVHRAATCLSYYSDNFCWAVRTLRRPDGRAGPCSPAMAAGQGPRFQGPGTLQSSWKEVTMKSFDCRLCCLEK